MNKIFLLCVPIFAISGCANVEYTQYLEAQTRIEANAQVSKTAEAVARHNADAAKYKAMSDIAATGSESAKIAAVMAIALGTQGAGNTTVSSAPTQLHTPPTNQALQWASILVPSLTNIVGVAANMRVSTVQSNNAREIAVSTNATFAGLGTNIQNTANAGNNANVAVAGLIQAPQATITTTTTNTVGGDAVIGSGTMTKTDSHAVSTTTATDNHAVSTTTATDNHSVSTDNHAVTSAPVKITCTTDAVTHVTTCI